MELIMDEDAKAVAEFMQRNCPASKLVAVARILGEAAPLLWGRYRQEEVHGMTLRMPPISVCAQQTQSNASE